MQSSLNLDRPLPLSFFVSHQNSKLVQFCDKLKQLHSGPFKIVKKPKGVTYEF